MLPKQILIIKTGSTHPHISQKYGDFEDWIISGTTLHSDQFKILDVISDDNYPDPKQYSSIIITGSHDNVTENPSWMSDLTLWLHDVRTMSVPTLGICFGHQLLAHAFGGSVDFSPKGREFGSKEIVKTELTQNDALFCDLPTAFMANESHSQAVMELPVGAKHLASNNHTKYQAFVLDDIIWGVQFHPEFSQIHMQEYMNVYMEELNQTQIDSIQIKSTPESYNILKQFVSLHR